MIAAFHPRVVVPVLLCLGLLIPLSGCGGSSSGLIPVAGKVTVDDKPLTKGTVAYHPEDKGQGKKTPSGEIGADGSYQLYTEGKPGAPPGKYKVTVVSAGEVDSAKPQLSKSTVGRQFSDPKLTPLAKEVSASSKDYDLKVSAK
ncbi:MAG: hypothetical protein L0Z62_10405 [Gemmataceae bacterium]|nr:hypothetical protein [Gemmataceae bacterium]